MIPFNKNILVLGGSGELGSYLVLDLKAMGYSVLTPTHKELDILNLKKADNLGHKYNTDILINLVAWTNTLTAEDPANWNKVLDHNLWLPNYMREHYLDNQIIFHLSTDYVYDGDTPNSKETDLLRPWNRYGISKALCDQELLALDHPNLYIIRTSFKPKIWKHPEAFTDIITNADTTDVISKLITKFIQQLPKPGIYNIGTETKSVFDLIQRTNSHIKPAKLIDSDFKHLLKPNLTMNLNKFKELNL